MAAELLTKEKGDGPTTLDLVMQLNEKLKKELPPSEDAESTRKVKRLLRALDKCRMTLEILSVSLVVKTVKNWKQHSTLSPGVKELLKRWKRDAKQGGGVEEQSVGRQPPAAAVPTTTVCNVKVAYIRPQYQNLKAWMEDSDKNEYIGRAGVVFVDKVRFPPQQSIWANPFKIKGSTTRADVIKQYEGHLREKLREDPALKEELLKLDGKRLGCWCHPEGCHGHVLVKAIQEIKAGMGDW